MADKFWTVLEVNERGSTSVKNLPNGCLLREIVKKGTHGDPSVSLLLLQGMVYEDGDFRALTMSEVIGDDMGGMLGKMDGLQSLLNKGFQRR